jgi:hypothetical protein
MIVDLQGERIVLLSRQEVVVGRARAKFLRGKAQHRPSTFDAFTLMGLNHQAKLFVESFLVKVGHIELFLGFHLGAIRNICIVRKHEYQSPSSQFCMMQLRTSMSASGKLHISVRSRVQVLQGCVHCGLESNIAGTKENGDVT